MGSRQNKLSEVVWLGFGVSLIRLGTFVRLRTLFAWVSLVRLHFGWVVGSFGLLRNTLFAWDLLNFLKQTKQI